MGFKIVNISTGEVHSHHETIDDAERELIELVDEADSDPSSTFMSSASPYRIVDDAREWTFNTVTNRYEWR